MSIRTLLLAMAGDNDIDETPRAGTVQCIGEHDEGEVES